ncbi:MAG: YwbE family protein [Methanoregulaceae archaeon]|jgi:uncharacterized repeat protein (TIGR03833 family)|nr:YwbE family protein [Methanoregulaceae archaeon]MCU0628053.1 YwbE family protein [Methanoregulaceae archaeon]
MGIEHNNRTRSDIRPGLQVRIIQKKDQRSGKLTEGTVREILTSSSFHPHGIKVRLNDGTVGRVSEICGPRQGDRDR